MGEGNNNDKLSATLATRRSMGIGVSKTNLWFRHSVRMNLVSRRASPHSPEMATPQ